MGLLTSTAPTEEAQLLVSLLTPTIWRDVGYCDLLTLADISKNSNAKVIAFHIPARLSIWRARMVHEGHILEERVPATA